MCCFVKLPLIIAAAGLLLISTPAGGFADPQPSDMAKLLELRKGIYDAGQFLNQIPRPLPAYVAGFCAVLLLFGLFGFYELRATTIALLLAAIGAIVYKFYWPP